MNKKKASDELEVSAEGSLLHWASRGQGRDRCWLAASTARRTGLLDRPAPERPAVHLQRRLQPAPRNGSYLRPICPELLLPKYSEMFHRCSHLRPPIFTSEARTLQ